MYTYNHTNSKLFLFLSGGCCDENVMSADAIVTSHGENKREGQCNSILCIFRRKGNCAS